MADVLEIMAKAAWEHPDGPTLWRDLPENMRTGEIAAMRAALLALAEAELPEDALDASSIAAQGIKERRDRLKARFRSICRSLAEGGGND